MSLRLKAVFGVIAVLVISSVTIILFSQLILLQGYYELEEDALQEDMRRVANAIENHANSLRTNVIDYARWDETISYIESGGETDFPREHLDDFIFQNFQIDLALVLDADNRILFVNKTTDFNEAWVVDLIQSPQVIPADEVINGMWVLNDLPLIMASTPIEKNNNRLGTLIWVRYLDDAQIASLGEAVQLDLRMQVYNGQPITPIDKISTNRIQGNLIIDDMVGEEALLVTVETTRDVIEEGRSSTILLVMFMIVGAVVAGIISLLLQEKLVIKRLRVLRDEIRQIGEDGNFSSRVTVDSADEISDLSSSINDTFQALQQAQAERSASEKRLQTVISSLPIIVFAMDADGVFTLLDGLGLTDLPFEPQDMLGKLVFDVYDDNTQIKAAARRALKGEQFKETIKIQDLAFESYYVPVYDGRKLIGVTGVSVNVTEREQKAAELREAKEAAESANYAKSTFLANMSHELRTPLNAIIGFTGIMLMNESINEKDRHRAERIQNNGERLLSIIDDVLDMSRIEAGRVNLVADTVKIRDLLFNLQSPYKLEAKQKDIMFISDISADIPDMIQIDPDAFSKIITNLLSNAVKFTNEGKIQMNMYREDHQLVIRVQDTGIGIPSHMHEVIFESFQQADGSSTREFGGTGLGLSIVYHLCLAMNGTIQLDSKVNQGTTFTVKLPIL